MKRKRGVTLADVARITGLDTSTVSRVINGDSNARVAPATRERILSAAQRLGYRAHPVARALRAARSYTLGIVVPQLDNPVFARLIAGAELASRERGYSLIISHVDEGDSASEAYARMAQTYRVDGLLAATLEDGGDLARTLREMDIPYVTLNRQLEGDKHYAVFDSHAASRLATEHLISLGHRRIVHVGGRAQGYNGRQRLAGYLAAMAAAGLPAPLEWVEAAGYTFEGGELAMRRLIQIRPRPTGIVAATILAAAGAMKFLHAHDVRIPQDMSIVAVHDAVIADVLHPALTTVRLPVQELGARAAHGLVDLIEGRTDRVEVTLAPQGLIERASTARVPAGSRARDAAGATQET